MPKIKVTAKAPPTLSAFWFRIIILLEFFIFGIYVYQVLNCVWMAKTFAFNFAQGGVFEVRAGKNAINASLFMGLLVFLCCYPTKAADKYIIQKPSGWVIGTLVVCLFSFIGLSVFYIAPAIDNRIDRVIRSQGFEMCKSVVTGKGKYTSVYKHYQPTCTIPVSK